jgi:hypothetical protein
MADDNHVESSISSFWIDPSLMVKALKVQTETSPKSPKSPKRAVKIEEETIRHDSTLSIDSDVGRKSNLNSPKKVNCQFVA